MILNDLYTGSRNNAITESRTYKLWESAGHKLVEAQLTADQINQLFQQVEQGATAAGGNRTLVGKGKDAASAINTAWEDLKTKVQNSGPIKNVDAMYDQAAEQLKQATGGDEGVMKYVQKYRDFAKKHPVAQSLIYSALIAAAGISGAGIGGAAALGLFKLVDKLLQGEKFSSAAYSGAKTGAMAYAAGQIGQALKGKPPEELPGTQGAPGSYQRGSGIGGTTDAAASTVSNLGPRDVARSALTIFKEKVANGEVTDYNSYQSAMRDALVQAGEVGGKTAGATTQRMAQQILDAQLDGVAARAAGGTFSGSGPDKVAAVIKALGGQVNQQAIDQANSAVRSLAGGMAGNAINAAPNATFESKKLTELEVKKLVEAITAEGVMDTLKGAAGKAVNWAQTKGKNLTTKVTADKLMQAWKKAGSPMDSLDVASIIQRAGVSSDIIKQVYAGMNIPFPGGAATTTPAATTPAATTPATTATATPAAATPAAKSFAMPQATSTTAGMPSKVTYGKGFEKKPATTTQFPAFGTAGSGGYATAPAATSVPTTPTLPKPTTAKVTPAAPAAPAAPKAPATPAAPGTVGTYDTKTGAAKLGGKTMVALKDLPPAAQKRVAAVAEQANRMLENVKTKQDAEAVRLFIDQQFSKHGLLESALPQRKQLMDHVNKVSAIRRRLHARDLLA